MMGFAAVEDGVSRLLRTITQAPIAINSAAVTAIAQFLRF
jgi:hypothetical protein